MPTVSYTTHLPDYEILSELGRGNTRVLKARHLPSGDIVAIKQYAFAADADTLRRFERESQIMTQINHPNVVRVREVQLGTTMPYVVMDFVEGGDLRSLLRQEGYLDVPTTIRLGLQMTGAFRAINAMKVIHRDIKPENVLYRRLISGELHFLLSDFGIAKFWADDSIRTLTGQSLMTYEYAAPEQFDNPRLVDEAADYYALGAVLYECLMGQVPFVLQNEKGLAQFVQQVLTAPLPTLSLPSGQPVPPSLTTLLTGLLTRDPQTRLRNTDRMELLLEQSRVEQLQAKWSGQTPPVSTAKTMVGPVVTPSVQQSVTDASVEEFVEETHGTNWQWWGISGILLAAALALWLYTRSANQASDGNLMLLDSMATTPADSTQFDTEAVSDSISTYEPLEEEATEKQIPAESTPQSSGDSNTNNSVVIPDSIRVVPPDTTQ